MATLVQPYGALVRVGVGSRWWGAAAVAADVTATGGRAATAVVIVVGTAAAVRVASVPLARKISSGRY